MHKLSVQEYIQKVNRYQNIVGAKQKYSCRFMPAKDESSSSKYLHNLEKFQNSELIDFANQLHFSFKMQFIIIVVHECLLQLQIV